VQFGHVQHESDRFNYQGAAFQFVGFDELTHFTEAIYLYIGFSRQRRRMDIADIPVQTFASANPGGIGHIWVKHRFLDKRAHDVLFVPAKVDDNPGLDRADYEASLIHLPLGLRQQLMAGDWEAFEGAAYQDFDDTAHVVPIFPIPPQWERFEFMDHGTANPTAWYLCAVDYDGNLIVVDSYYSPGLISEHVNEVLRRRPAWYPEWTDLSGKTHMQYPTVIADPAVTTRLGTMSKTGEPATIATEYADQSAGKVVLIPGNHDRQAGKARIEELLRCDPERPFPEWHPRRGERGAPRLYIVGQRNPELIEQVKSAPLLGLDSGKKGAGEIVDPDWESQYGHGHAALRYGVMSRPDATAPGEKPESEDPRRAFLDRIEAREREGYVEERNVYVIV
jgi:hypothetical protein